MQKLAAATIVLAFSTFASPANAALKAFLDAETGAPNEVTWLIGMTNTGAAAAMDVKMSSASLTQTAGAACTPVVTLPGALGTIASGVTALASLTINFSGCPTPNYPLMPPPPPGAPLFTLDAAFSADGLTGSLILTNLAPLDDGTVYPATAASVPEASTWVLMLLGFCLVGAARAGRCRLMLPRSAQA